MDVKWYVELPEGTPNYPMVSHGLDLSSKALEWLSLTENSVGDVGLQALAVGLKRSCLWVELLYFERSPP